MDSLTIGSQNHMKQCNIDNKKMLDIYKIIGQNVKSARTKKKVSQLKLALEIGHNSVGTISVGELCLNGKHFNIEHLVKIADVLEVDVKDFFEGI